MGNRTRNDRRSRKTTNKRPPTRDHQQETTNKSHEVRKYLAQHPDARPSEIVKALAPTVQITPGFVANIKSKFKRGKPAGAAVSAPRQPRRAEVAVDHLLAAAELLRLCGGIDQARAALEVAHRIAKATH